LIFKRLMPPIIFSLGFWPNMWEKLLADLKELGKVEKKDELAACIDLPLACHKCEFKPKNMPELKKHIAIHS